MWRMANVLGLYEEPYDPKRPVVCFEEMPYQMVAEKRSPIYLRQGRVPRTLRLRVPAQRGAQPLHVLRAEGLSWRHVDVRERRTAVGFAQQVEEAGRRALSRGGKEIRMSFQRPHAPFLFGRSPVASGAAGAGVAEGLARKTFAGSGACRRRWPPPGVP